MQQVSMRRQGWMKTAGRALALALVASAVVTPAMAQERGENGRTVYEATFFQPFAPATARPCPAPTHRPARAAVQGRLGPNRQRSPPRRATRRSARARIRKPTASPLPPPRAPHRSEKRRRAAPIAPPDRRAQRHGENESNHAPALVPPAQAAPTSIAFQPLQVPRRAHTVSPMPSAINATPPHTSGG